MPDWSNVKSIEEIEYLQQYIVNFAATWDATHFCFGLDRVVVPCDLELAHRLAEQSWEDIGSKL